MATNRVYLTVFLLLFMAISATWGACEYTCIIADKDDGYGGCSLKMTYDDTKTKCMDCYEFCREYGREESVTQSGASSVITHKAMMIPIIIMTVIYSKWPNKGMQVASRIADEFCYFYGNFDEINILQ